MSNPHVTFVKKVFFTDDEFRRRTDDLLEAEAEKYDLKNEAERVEKTFVSAKESYKAEMSSLE